MAERIVWGVVTWQGKIRSGHGFVVDKSGKGTYTVLFDESFNVGPAVTATQIYEGFDRQGGSTRDNVVLVFIDNDRFRVKTGDDNGQTSDRDFSFIAVGS